MLDPDGVERISYSGGTTGSPKSMATRRGTSAALWSIPAVAQTAVIGVPHPVTTAEVYGRVCLALAVPMDEGILPISAVDSLT